MKKILIALFILSLAACTSKPVTKDRPAKPFIVKNLTDFFIRYERDLINAKKVIIEKDIVKNLTHLQNMNYGGKKYYILEREAITKMLQSVTEGVYDDFIIVNKKGTVIYTMLNDEIFYKNVRSKNLPQQLTNSYNRRDIPVYFQGISKLSTTDRENYIFCSSKVSGGNSFPGIFVLQVSSSKVTDLLEKGTSILSMDGKYILTSDPEKFGTGFEHMELINIDLRNNHTASFTVTTKEENTIVYTFFKYKQIEWILVKTI